MNKAKLFGRYFSAYLKFSFYENQLALIEGRNYQLIYAFFDILCELKTSSSTTSTSIASSISLLEKGVESFIACSQQKYIFLKECDQKIDTKDETIIDKFNEDFSSIFDEFVIVYTQMIKYKDSLLIEELLIEFNNFLSHFIYFIKDNDCSSGKSHLFRGCLDGYKDIILENTIVLVSNKDLINRFITLRIDENKDIGKILNNNYENILNEYKEIAFKFITMLNCSVIEK